MRINMSVLGAKLGPVVGEWIRLFFVQNKRVDIFHVCVDFSFFLGPSI